MTFRKLAIAGIMATILGVSASAEAMPIAPTSATWADGAPVTTVQYYRYGYGHRYRHYYRYGYRRRAGVYRCGPGEKSTHLQRKACGGAFPRQRF